MIRSIKYSSAAYVTELPACDKTIVISIRDYFSKVKLPDLTKFKDSLTLCFKDRCEEEYLLDFPWPDYISETENRRYLLVPNEELFDMRHARQAKDFFETHHAKKEKLNLIVHCRAGVSRSAALASFFADEFKIPLESERNKFRPNPRVLRVMNKLYGYDKYVYENPRNNFSKLYQLDVPKSGNLEG